MREHLGVHETLEIHELMTFKSLCLTKASVMQALVSDPNLKEIMKLNVKQTTKHIEELRDHLI